MKRTPAALLLAATILASSCGGNSSPTSPVVDSDFAAGDLVGRAAATNPPVTTTSNAVAATGIKGTFSSLKLRELEPSLDETRIIHTSNYQGSYQLYSMAPDGSDSTKITSINGAIVDVDASPQGKIAYTAYIAGNYDIYTANLDGTSPTPIVSNPASDGVPRWSSDGTKIAFVSDRTGTYNIFILNLATLAVTQVTNYSGSGPFIFDLVFSRDGSYIYYNTGTSILRIPSSGGITTTIRATAGGFQHLAASPDGSEIAITESNTGTYSIIRQGVSTGAAVVIPVDNVVQGIAYSPDSEKLVFSMSGSTFNSNVFVLDKDTGSIQKITNNLGYNDDVTWSYPVKDRTLIAGGGGILGTTAAGVIYAQQGASTKSVVTFEATTPSSVVITAQTGLGDPTPNLVFSVDADNIPKMAFANGTNWRGTRIVGSGTPVLSANGALVSIDAFTGKVVSILPFSGSRATGARPTVKIENGKQTFTGSFVAAYDSAGKNVAPNGATRVEYDPRTGALTAR